MSVRRIKAGTTDVSVTIRIVDSTDGTPETGVVFNTSGIDLWYRREGEASVDITEATLAALTTAHTDGGFLHINDGWYRLDLPDAACASGVAGVQIGGTVTGMVVLAPYIELPVNTEEDVYTRIGAPAGASVSADIAAIEAQTDDIGVAGAGLTAVPWNAAWDAEVQSEVADALAVYDPPTNAELVSEINAVQTDIAALNDLDAAGVRSAVGLASANLDTQLSAIDDFLDTEVAAILEDTGTTIPAQISALNNLSAAQVNAEVVDALNTDTYAEPGQGSPAATATLVAKIGYLYKAWRNRSTQTASEYALYADDGTTKDQEAAVSDDGTTLVRGEVTTGA